MHRARGPVTVVIMRSSRRSALAFVLSLAIGVLACGARTTSVRMATYDVSVAQLAGVTEEILRELDYPHRTPEVERNHTSFEVGPLLYDSQRQRIDVTPGMVPDGTYRVTLFVAAVSGRFSERYLDIRPAVFRREGGTWKPQYATQESGMRRNGTHVDPFKSDTWLARIADPIFEGVHARLTPPR